MSDQDLSLLDNLIGRWRGRDVHRLLQHYAPRFIGDVMLPHTFVPGRS